MLRVDGPEGLADGFVAGNVVVDLAGGILIGRADEEVAVPFAVVSEGVGLVDHDVLEPAVAQGVAFFDRVKPADHALAAGAGAEFDPLEFDGERVGVVHLRQESVRTDLGVVGLGDAEGVNALHGDAGALEELRRVGVRGRDVG